MKRKVGLILLICLATVAFVVKTVGKDEDNVGREKWEYLVVAGPSTTNFSPSGNSKMRKSEGSFGREAFVLEQHLDKLGAEGWQLINVVGADRDPVFYFKRAK